MARFIVTRSNFLGGELSQRGDGRVDLPQYNLGCKQLRNFIPIPSGGITKRPGTIYVGKAEGSGSDCQGARVIPFIFSNNESYIVILWNDSSATNIRVIDISDNSEQTVTVSTLPVKISNLNEIQFVQSADIMFLAHYSLEPFLITRSGSPGSYVFTYSPRTYGSPLNIFLNYPFLDDNISAITMTVNGSFNQITASASYFTSGNAGGYIRVNTGYYLITNYVSATVVDVLAMSGSTPVAGTTDDWAESAWSNRRGWPRAIGSYNNRLIYGGTIHQPDTFWASQTSDFFQLEPIGVGVSDPQRFTISSDRLNQIQWIVGGKKLTIGTIGGEIVGEFKEDGTEIFVQFYQETTHGSAYIQPQRVAYAIPFIQRSKRRLRELVFDYNSDSYVANDLTLLKEDLAEGTWNNAYEENELVQLSYTEAPFPCVWAIDKSGKLYSCTRERNQQISAWATHLIGGIISENSLTGLSGNDHHAFVESICVTPAPDNTYDRLWMVVKRDINGSVVHYVEYMDKFRSLNQLAFNGNTGEAYFYFVDCAKYAYSASPVNSFSGFNHMEGETVSVMADGKYVGEIDVSSGTITLPSSQTANAIVAGFKYKSRLKTMRQEGGSNVGGSVGSIRRVDSVRLNIFKTRFFKFGFESEKTIREILNAENEGTQTDAFDSELEDHMYFDPDENPGDPFYVENDIVTKSAPNSSDKKAIGIVLSDLPYPCTILSITLRAVEHDV